MALPRNLTPPRFAGRPPCFPPFRRAGVHARRTLAISKSQPCAAAGSGGMRASRPTFARTVAAVPVDRSFRKVCRGGIYPARRRVSEANRRAAAALRPEIPPAGVRAAARFPGRCEHRPLQRLQQRGAAAVRFDRSFRKVCRGGFHIRPRVSAPPQGPRADMESAPTGVYNHTIRLRLPARPAFSPRRPACTGGALFVPGRPRFFRALFAKRRKSVYNRRNGGGRAAAIL